MLTIFRGKSSFKKVADMNKAFGNPEGNRQAINWDRIESQCKNIFDEYQELMQALAKRDLDAVRDALGDINVFSYGASHLLGVDGDEDLTTIVDAVMTRFIKDDDDYLKTIQLHSAKGVTQVEFSGEYPTMVMKSGCDQPDAPKGKFLKSASYSEPRFK